MKMKEVKSVEFMKQILENNIERETIMRYVEMTIEEAMKRCNKNKKILVAIQDLEDDSVDTVFVQKERSEYQSMFEDVKTVASACDDFVKQLRLFTEKQNIFNIEPKGIQKIILLKE